MLKKWNRCAISLSGGVDSKTTLASANGLYDKFSYFSFFSKEQELVDAKAARQICNNLGLKHTIYRIPENNNEIKDFQFIKKSFSTTLVILKIWQIMKCENTYICMI